VIDQQTIGKILDASNIVDVVGDFVTLKKRGVNYIGSCPFHNEKTPSFTVSPSKGICKCFGCGAGGNSVNFIMELENMSYPEALKYLARKYNIPIEEKELSEEEKDQKSKNESLRIITDFAGKYFNESLLKSDEGTAIGLSYFKERGINHEIINKFQLGYCPNSGSAFTDTALKNGYKEDLLIEIGLSKKGHSLFDFFKGRVIFPIHNLSGHVIAFGGRTLQTSKKIAKYFNSPESPLYHKSDVLYGIFQAKRAITSTDKCFLVEGYTDVTSLHQAGIENVVASSGTALTSGQIRLIKRFTDNITILYDGDAAGIKAALKGIDLVLEQGLNVRVVLLPEGEDPDSFARSQSQTSLMEYLNSQETDFIHFKSELLLKDANNDPVKRADATRSIVDSISKVPDTFLRNEYVRTTALIMKIGEDVLNNEVRKRIHKQIEKANHQQFNIAPSEPSIPQKTVKNKDLDKFGKDYFQIFEESLLKYLIRYSNNNLDIENDLHELETKTVAQYIFDELMIDEINFTNEIFADIFLIAFEQHRKTGSINQQFFINHSDPHISKVSSDIIASKHELSILYEKQNIIVEQESQKLSELIPNVIINYKSRSLSKLSKDLEIEIRSLSEENNMNDIIECMTKLAKVRSAIKQMSKLTNRIIP